MVDLERAKDILSGNSRDYGTLRLLPYDDLSTLYSIIAEIFHQNRISEGSLYDTFRPYLDTLVLISFFFFHTSFFYADDSQISSFPASIRRCEHHAAHYSRPTGVHV